nr:ATP-binding protein [Cryptomonas curvata]
MYGQLVLGSPGSGKTSFCFAMKQIIYSAEDFPLFINLDPGNKISLSDFDINIQELINSDEIIPELNIGPNGSLLYSIEYFEKNSDWFESKFKYFLNNVRRYHFLFDFPGQIELFTHHLSIRNFIKKILSINIKLVGLTLTDSFFFKDKSSRNSLLLVCIIIMLNIELPHIHLLSKSDLFLTRNSTENCKQLSNNKYTKLSTIYHNSLFLWSKKLTYDFIILINDFSSLNSLPVSIFYPKSLKMIYKKIKNINIS